MCETEKALLQRSLRENNICREYSELKDNLKSKTNKNTRQDLFVARCRHHGHVIVQHMLGLLLNISQYFTSKM